MVRMTVISDKDACAAFGDGYTPESEACIECTKLTIRRAHKCKRLLEEKLAQMMTNDDIKKWLKDNKNTPKRIGKKIDE